MKNKSNLVIIRGLPGSGKSTLAAQKFPLFRLIEADQFFTLYDSIEDYNFDKKFIHAAHKWCESMVEYWLFQGKNVVVANTFTTLQEMEPYFKLARTHGAHLKIITATHNYVSIHPVPDDVIEAMKKRWEEIDEDLIFDYYGLTRYE